MAIYRDWVLNNPERSDPDPRRLVVCRTRQGAVEIRPRKPLAPAGSP